MSAFYKYIDDLVAGTEVEDDFPKNESSWEELFDFGKNRIIDIVTLKRNLARLQAIEADGQFIVNAVNNGIANIWVSGDDAQKFFEFTAKLKAYAKLLERKP